MPQLRVTAHGDRLSPQLWVVQDLYGGIKVIKIAVKNDSFYVLSPYICSKLKNRHFGLTPKVAVPYGLMDAYGEQH